MSKPATKSEINKIKQRLSFVLERIEELKQNLAVAELDLHHIQQTCPHSDKKRCTNNDGEGQFTVERCLICGLQRDGGLR